MAFALQVLVGGLVAIDLGNVASSYFVHSRTLVGFGEPEIEAEYSASAQQHGSTLASRRFRNREVGFQLAIAVTAGGVDAREVARNAVADVIDLARRYQVRETDGTTAAEGEVLLKYRPPNGTQPLYARVLDGGLGSSEFTHGGGALGTVAGRAVDALIPVTLIVEPFWHPERDFYLRNCLLNGGFEAGYPAGSPAAPYGWAQGGSGAGITSTYGSSASFVRSGTVSHLMHISASTTTGTQHITQSVMLANVGVSAGQTILISAWVYIYSVTGTGRASLSANDGDAHMPATAITNTTGQWVRLWMVVDIASAATSVAITLTVQAQNIGDTIFTFWDEVQVQPHVDNLLLGGGFSHEWSGIPGLAQYWTYAETAGTGYTPTLSSTAKYDEKSQQITIAAAAATSLISLSQSVTLATHNAKAGDVLTFGAWLDLVTLSGAESVYVTMEFLDATPRIVSVVTDSSPTLTAGGGPSWHSVTGTVPIGATSVKMSIKASVVSGGATTVRADWATLYRGHSDQSARRFWPWSDRSEVLLPVWSDSARLTSNPAATDGKQIALDHTGLPGNVPGPCQLVIGCSDEIPNPLIAGYKRGTTALTPWVATVDGTIVTPAQVAASSADADAIGSVAAPATRRIWTPATTTETLLLNWSGADAPPGRYLILVRAKLSDSTHSGRYSFRAAARLDNANTAAGSWSLILHSAPAWVNTSGAPGYEIWSAGVIPLPLRSRLPAYVNATRFELWARASATGGTVSLDAVYFLPLDGFAKLEKSSYAMAYPANGNVWCYTALIDSITPLPGGLYAYTGATFPTLLPSSFEDQPDAEEEPIYLGDRGQITVIHSGALHVKTYTQMMAILYRPWFSTAGVVS